MAVIAPVPTDVPPAPPVVAAAEVVAPAADPAAVPIASRAPSPARVEAHSFESQTLGRSMKYITYLPPGYDSDTTTRYPVLYMLHGAGADAGPRYDEWYQLGMFDRADELLAAGQITPFIIVLPQGDLSYWMDQAGDGPQYGTYMARDVVEEIDHQFRTRPDRTARAVGGLSMGADGALQLAFNFPDVFSIVGAHSASLPRPGYAPSFYGDLAYYRDFDPITLAQLHPEIALSLTVWIDVGDEDPRLVNDSVLHNLLNREGVDHEWHVFPGIHHSQYWADHIVDYLQFYNSAFNSSPM